jgi:16S rRNA (guanine527-N7)-methyltransferase
MDASRIAELLAPFLDPRNACHSEEQNGEESAVLSQAQLNDISTYIDILLRWNARINLTAIRGEEEIVTRHFGESLFAAQCLLPRYSASSASSALKAFEVADLGSGAGFPGIPIKIWAPEISLTLIESNHKKATFLREVVRALTLTDVDIQNVRAESLPPHSFDLVTLRAVERFDTILPIASGLLAPTGRLAILIGSAQLPTARAILPQLTWSKAVPIPGSRSRVLAIAEAMVGGAGTNRINSGTNS